MSEKSNFERVDLDENPKIKIPMHADEKEILILASHYPEPVTLRRPINWFVRS